MSSRRVTGALLNDQRPMFGRLPWLAFERRSLAFFFFVFFDIGVQGYRPGVRSGHPVRDRYGDFDPAQASRSSASIVLITRSSGTSHSAARLQPWGCHSSWPVEWASESMANQQP